MLTHFPNKKTFKVILYFFILLLVSPVKIFANPINEKLAKQVAINFYFEQINQYKQTDYLNIKISSTQIIKRNEQPVIFIFNFQSEGFVMVSADDAAIPVLGYDFSNKIDFENQSPTFEAWLNGYANQIEEIWQKKLSANQKIDSLWKALGASNSSKLVISGSKSQQPLLISNWDQGAKYNTLCPAEQFGPGGHVYAGCVAVAMAQVMYYYKYPQQGTGSYSFYDYNYGQLTANFGTTTYKWNEMANQMPSDGNYEIAQLLYHCGVAVDMNYSASGSGAWSNLVVGALQDYFKYSSSVHLENKSGYSESQWSAKIIQSLDNKIPLYYHGYPSSSGSGHAFNLDGYQGTDYFHFNWGWSGSYNGYFYLNNLNPGGSDFSSGQAAIFDIKPLPANYPTGCTQPTTITSLQGVLYDGSGPENYSINNNCQWLISPSQNIDYIELEFDRLDLAAGDTIIIFDGTSTSDSILKKIYTTLAPGIIKSSGTSMLIQFQTDNTLNGDGFDASFEAKLPVFCQGTLILNDSTGYFTDGSDTNNYNNEIMCKWIIDSPINKGITLHFTKFNTESGNDWVKIYDPTVSPSKLLGQFSGNQIPQGVSADNGKMLIIFASNESNSSEGWEAYYFTGNVGLEETTDFSDLNIYPNPTDDQLFIEGLNLSKIINIQLFTIDGRLIVNQEAMAIERINLDLSKISNGLYILKLTSSTNAVFRKIEIRK